MLHKFCYLSDSAGEIRIHDRERKRVREEERERDRDHIIQQGQRMYNRTLYESIHIVSNLSSLPFWRIEEK